METLSKTAAADATRDKEPCPPPASGVVSESLSLPSYKDYPAHRPFINTLVHHTPQTRTHHFSRTPSPSKAFPETSSAAEFHIVCCLPNPKFPFTYCSVSELHGYMCNMILHHLNVSAAPPSIHSSTSSSLSSYPAHVLFLLKVKNISSHHAFNSIPDMFEIYQYINMCLFLSYPHNLFGRAAILSALRNLQDKIRRLELEKGHAELSLRSVGKDVSHTFLQNEKVNQRFTNNQTDTERKMSGQSNCNQVLVTHLAAAESRCVKLERQLDHMRRMLRNARTERTSLLKQQAFIDQSADHQPDTVSEHAQLDKLERLEQEYLRLTRTQNNAEMKIQELEMKLQEEEHQRKLIQDKANQLQTGLEANRILLKSVSPCLSNRQSKERKSSLKKSSPQQLSCTQPHYRLSLRDVPFVAGTSVGCSHSVRANVQSVLSLLKQHQPHLCNSRVLSHNTNGSETGSRRRSDSSSSSSSSTSGEEMSDLLQALQEELRLMSLEHDELMRQLEDSVSERERKELRREQERLLMKMERKGEQISKLYKHKSQVKKLRKEANSRQNRRNEVRVCTTVSTRGRSAGAGKVRPGERSKRNLRLLRDMKALQTSLRT